MLSANVAATPFDLKMEVDSTGQAVDITTIDFQLMERVGAGDHEAFRELVERHQGAVVGTVAKMLGNPSEAEDIAQQVFLRIWRNAKRYRPDAKFTTYLYTITRNLVFNETRRRSRKKEVSADELEENSNQLIAASSDRQPDSELLQVELQRAVDAAIAGLPQAQRMAVVLRRYEQLPYEEIAEVLSLSVSAVKSLLFRARTTLRETLSGYLES
ncbi:MAG: sigma-70 family RNA polymerase sigma factor [Akkermansiaceae bacterium]|jgi:RNA polymerase sigma-70 factor (ECF subfamily)|nr:sigma-70 family RNA polymerase sigma factor [Akkermansiaceae bacterium]